MKKLVNKEISSKILMVGEYFKNNAPGGMAAVLASYDMYFEDMKFIPTWKYGTLMIKIWYTIIHIFSFSSICSSIEISKLFIYKGLLLLRLNEIHSL